MSNINVFGAGYIGCVTAFCLGELGLNVTLFERDKKKLELLKNEEPIFFERAFNWDEFYSFVTVKNIEEYKSNSDGQPGSFCLLCVNVELSEDGYDFKKVSELIKDVRLNGDTPVLRSTIGPGEVDILSEELGFEFLIWPEFLREGSAIYDFKKDDNFISGPILQAEKLENIVGLPFIHAPNAETLCALKTMSNAFRALKVSFANSVPELFKQIDVEWFNAYFPQLRGNGDGLYLKSGAPFGGYCLPKELEYISSKMEKIEQSNFYAASLAFNEEQILRKANEIISTGIKSLVVYGFNFKEGTDDIRNSPTFKVAMLLQKAGICVYDGDGSSKNTFHNSLGGEEASFGGSSDGKNSFNW